MVQVVTLADAFFAVLPAAGLFFWAYGRYDGLFRDNVVFLFFIGGLLAGGFLGIFSLFAFVSASGPLILLALVLIALLVPITLVAAINRRKWQGDRHSVFNGGALGLGTAVMMALTSLYYRSRLLGDEALVTNAGHARAFGPPSPADLDQFARDHTFTLPDMGQAFVLAAGLALIVFALGLFAGDAVRRRKQIGGAFVMTAVFLAPAIFLEELVQDWRLHAGGEWLWTLLLLAYGAIIAFFAERRLMPEGLTDEGRRFRRRARRKAME